ncbi:unnamed protein product [Periconia digitata]|uniref:Uncharacterized protein n=1 Tax=Periconia digitata TaxID=1303443 RepID=A0A9W4U263_9PLEO|nr:unnamed protein product [Periconia digitata]
MLSEMMSMLERKTSLSANNISWSTKGIWSLSCAVISSITEWSSGGRVADFCGSVDSVDMRVCVSRSFMRED